VIDLNGRRLGKYILDRPVGRGGMASVYLAHDPGLNRPVAVKVMDPASTAEPDAVERFRPVDGFVPEPNPVFWALGQRSLPVTVERA